jgi:hypothetical protein
VNSIQQTLHILRKDLRHLAPEISISISLVALFAWIAPAAWPGYISKMAYPGAQFGAPQMMGGFLHALIPISWLVLISRCVHDESLVGDKQFWVTRPYTWYSLLGAKLIFVLTVICLPLLATQIFLVHYAGLPILASLASLLLNIGAIFLLFLVPFLVLASVTSSFGPLVLLVLGGVLYIGLVGLVATYLSGAHAIPPYASAGCVVLLALILIGALVYQYIERKTGQSQLIVLATPIVLAALFLILPAGFLFTHAYPTGGDISAKMDLDSMRQQPSSGSLLHVVGNYVLSLPLETGPGPATTLLSGRALQLELASASGFHWSSPWQGFSDVVGAGESLQVNVMVPQAVIDSIGAETVKLQLTLALNRLQLDTPVNFALAESDHTFPGVGVCSLVGDTGFGAPVCRSAMRAPMAFVETQVQDVPCGFEVNGPQPAPRAARVVMAPQQPWFAFDPVNAQGWRLNVAGDSGEGAHMHAICAGAPVKLTPTHDAGGVKIVVEQTGIELMPYLRHLSQQKPM